MKKIVTIFITLAILCTGCTKESLTPERNEVEVSFVFNNIAETGNIQTRAFSDNFSSWQYKNPSTVYLLNCNTGKTYTLDFTKSRTFSIEPGSYFAYSRKGNPQTLNRNFYANNAWEIPLEIYDLGLCSLENSEQTLGYVLDIQGPGECTLEVRHSAIVLACKREDVSYFKWYTDNQGWNEDYLHASDEYFYYILTVPDYLVVGGDQNKITVTVEMGGTESTEATQVSMDIIKSSRGKYFVFSPNRKGSTSFNMMNVQEWENGFE